MWRPPGNWDGAGPLSFGALHTKQLPGPLGWGACGTDLCTQHPSPSSQIGRSTENMIDFVVTDTSPGGGAAEGPSAQSTISRYACRILCDRQPPYTARIYAAGFDASSNIFLGVSEPPGRDRRFI